jgi:hypothetical protein
MPSTAAGGGNDPDQAKEDFLACGDELAAETVGADFTYTIKCIVLRAVKTDPVFRADLLQALGLDDPTVELAVKHQGASAPRNLTVDQMKKLGEQPDPNLSVPSIEESLKTLFPEDPTSDEGEKMEDGAEGKDSGGVSEQGSTGKRGRKPVIVDAAYREAKDRVEHDFKEGDKFKSSFTFKGNPLRAVVKVIGFGDKYVTLNAVVDNEAVKLQRRYDDEIFRYNHK